MKASRFNVVIPLAGDTHLVFNTFSDSRVIVSREVLGAIEGCGMPEALSEQQQDALDTLKQLGILLEDDVNEDKQLEYWFQRIKHDSSVVNATILTTMACNMDCVYCFEQGVDSHCSMTSDMVTRVCSWILDRVEDVRPRDLTVTFFGGEPLLNLRAVYGIARSLHEGVEQHGTTLNLELITNGLLLTREVVETLLPCGLRWAKITLDGDRAAHDRMRPRKSRGAMKEEAIGTYDDIMANLRSIRGLVPLIIGGNYDVSTKDTIPALLDDLVSQGFKPEDFKKIAFKPILAFPGHRNSSAHAIEACTYAETDMEDFWSLIEATEARGFPSYRKLGLGPCEAMRENNFTIDAAGNIYRCAAMAGRREYSIGHVDDELEDILFSPQNIAYITADAWRQCGDCPWVPLCAGGCRLGAVSATGTFDAIACEREYFEKISKRMVVEESV